MKNIHLIQTDKPTGIFESNSGLQFSIMKKVRYGEFKGYNLNITNNEEIKEGVDQWYLDKVLNEPYNSGGAQYSSKQDVITLTTDQDLIKDGVQAIDDEFLEWFVAHPSCEEVETKLVEFEVDMGLGESCIEYGSYYKIILPREESKQETTLEEALNKFVRTMLLDQSVYIDFLQCAKFGAKWQQEQDKNKYSEEDVINALHSVELKDNKDYSKIYNGMKEWFEQNKNK